MNSRNDFSRAIIVATQGLCSSIHQAIGDLTFQGNDSWAHHDLLYKKLRRKLGVSKTAFFNKEALVDIMLHLGYTRSHDGLGRLIWTGIGLRSYREEPEGIADDELLEMISDGL